MFGARVETGGQGCQDAPGSDRHGRKVASLAPGDVVGELGVLVRAPRNATVTTTVDSEVAVIGRRALNRLLADAPGFARKLLEALAERVRELDSHTVT
jgi:CRP-like cAMP-binding protein